MDRNREVALSCDFQLPAKGGFLLLDVVPIHPLIKADLTDRAGEFDQAEELCLPVFRRILDFPRV